MGGIMGEYGKIALAGLLMVCACGLYLSAVEVGRTREEFAKLSHGVCGLLLFMIGYAMPKWSGEWEWVTFVLTGICMLCGLFQIIFIWTPPLLPSDIDPRTGKAKAE